MPHRRASQGRVRIRSRLDSIVGGGTTAAGLVTLAVGAALTATPSRTAGILRLGNRPRVARALGVADLVLAPALLGPPPRWPWMATRASLNLVIAGVYVRESRDPASAAGALRGAAAMCALTVIDGGLAVALKASGR